MQPSAIVHPTSAELSQPPIQVGLVHGHMAARAKWPESAASGRLLDWRIMDAPEAKSALVDLWMVGTLGSQTERMDIARQLIDGPHAVPTLVLLHPRDDIAPWLELGADAYHETSSSPALLGQRIEALLPTPRSSDAPSTWPGLASAEAQFWQSTFDLAGAGLISGRKSGFLEALATLSELDEVHSQEEAIQRVRQGLKSVAWELNNPKATELLDLRTPVALECAFVDRLTPLHAQQMLEGFAELVQGRPFVSGEFLVRHFNGRTRYLTVEIRVPDNAEDLVLLTLLDISERIELEKQLREHVNLLEERVQERTLEIRQANARLELEGTQRQRLAEQVRQNLVHITQGVISAKHILEVALPNREALFQTFPKAMLIDRPRDIIGGDFMFLGEKNGQKTLALIDSTGHGVPGSMVALLGSMLINRSFISLEDPTPSAILHAFHSAFDDLMNTHSDTPQLFGFDGSVVRYEPDNRRLHFAGARGDLFLVRNGSTTILRGTRESIELLRKQDGEIVALPEFKEHSMDLEPGDQVYLATDGVRDQFGGTNNRKLGRKRLADLFEEHAHLPIQQREAAIQRSLLMWKGSNAKVDDATLVGFEVEGNYRD